MSKAILLDALISTSIPCADVHSERINSFSAAAAIRDAIGRLGNFLLRSGNLGSEGACEKGDARQSGGQINGGR